MPSPSARCVTCGVEFRDHGKDCETEQAMGKFRPVGRPYELQKYEPLDRRGRPARRGGTMYVTERLDELKKFDVDRMSVEEMIYLEMDAQRLRSAYETRAIPSPEWLTEQIRVLNVEVDRRKNDDMQKRLRELKAADAADMSASERREARKAERDRIERELAGFATAGTPKA